MLEPIRLVPDAPPTPIGNGAAFMEHSNGSTLIYSADVEEMEGGPFGIFDGYIGVDVAEAWYAGFLAGRERGRVEGRRQGFAVINGG